MIAQLITDFQRNRKILQNLIQGVPLEQQTWRSGPEKWCLLEIICHLIDEEKEDFRPRLKSVLLNPEKKFKSIDPQRWVKERDYMGQNFDEKVKQFLNERNRSIRWLSSLQDPNWSNTYLHPTIGPMSAHFILSNWMAHDLLHIRQIIRLRYDYLAYISGQSLVYAGNWI